MTTIKDEFDTRAADSQATIVEPLSAAQFDTARYADYAAALDERCRAFWQADSGVAVYRRMRVREVFAADCADMKKSLEWQLGGLEKSMAFKADVPNFLEPWYGLGTAAAAFGFDYLWEPGASPAVDGSFASVRELLAAPNRPIKDTRIGRHTLDMVDYFLNATQGRVPMSYCDVQSPLNVLGNIVEPNQFYMDFMLDPEAIERGMSLLADLILDFMLVQREMIGGALVNPGHGFASSRFFEGFGMSDDNVVMLPNDLYMQFAVPAMEKLGIPLGGPVFHSCGNWSGKKEDLLRIRGIRMVDGAFSRGTDPDPNPTEGFADTYANSGVVLNARIVGSPELILSKVRELWKPGMKLIVVTYCQTPEEQEYVYDRIHEICR